MSQTSHIAHLMSFIFVKSLPQNILNDNLPLLLGGGIKEHIRLSKKHKSRQLLYDFDGNIPDIQCLSVKTDEIVEVSLRDDGGWTLARKQEKEGFIPTSYFKLLQ